MIEIGGGAPVGDSKTESAPMVGRKSILLGMLTSGFVVAGAAQPSTAATAGRLSAASEAALSADTIVCSGKSIDPTGARDSTAGLRARFALATAGKSLYLPAGQYKISDRLTIANPGVSLEGAGGGASQLRPTFRNIIGAYLQLNASDI